MSIMPVWDNDDQTVLRYVYYGAWQWDDMDAAIAEAQAMTDFPVHVIVDLRESCTIPSLPMVKRPLWFTEDSARALVMVGEAYLTQPFFDIASRIYRLEHDREDVVYVDDLDDARTCVEAALQPRYI